MNNAYTCAYSCAKVIRAGNRNKQLSEYLNNEAQIPQARDRSGPGQNDQCFGGQIGHIGYCFLDKPLMNNSFEHHQIQKPKRTIDKQRKLSYSRGKKER